MKSQNYNFLSRLFFKRLSYSIIRIFVISSLISASSLLIIGYTYLENLGIFNIKQEHLRALSEWTPHERTLIYDKEKKLIGQDFYKFQIYTPIDKIPLNIINSLLAIEDKNFWTHPGIDFKAILRASIEYIKGGFKKPKQGGSTLTQQIVRHFLLTKEKTLERKIREIALSLTLEKYMSKTKILEIY